MNRNIVVPYHIHDAYDYTPTFETHIFGHSYHNNTFCAHLE